MDGHLEFVGLPHKLRLSALSESILAPCRRVHARYARRQALEYASHCRVFPTEFFLARYRAGHQVADLRFGQVVQQRHAQRRGRIQSILVRTHHGQDGRRVRVIGHRFGVMHVQLEPSSPRHPLEPRRRKQKLKHGAAPSCASITTCRGQNCAIARRDRRRANLQARRGRSTRTRASAARTSARFLPRIQAGPCVPG